MKKIFLNLISLILCLAASTLAGCGGGSGGGAPSAGAVAMTSSKTVALADGSDAATILAEVTEADGAPVADGTPVTFAVSEGGGTLSATTAATANGLASVDLTHPPITGAANRTVTITATAGGVSGSTGVKFINQPSSVDVFVAFDPAVSNLAGLDFNLNNTSGAAFDNTAQRISAINGAAGSLVVGNFDPTANSTRIGLINGSVSGVDTGATPIIKATFEVTADAGLTVFSIDQTAATFAATDPLGAATTPPVTAAEMIVTTTFDTEL